MSVIIIFTVARLPASASAASLLRSAWNFQDNLHYLFKGNQNPIEEEEDANYLEEEEVLPNGTNLNNLKRGKGVATRCNLGISHGSDNRGQKPSGVNELKRPPGM